MHQIAEDVHMISLTPRDGINAYLIGDVLIDSGVKQNHKKLVGQLKGRAVGAHTLTHAHHDHAGGSKRIMAALDIPMWAPGGRRRRRRERRAGHRGHVHEAARSSAAPSTACRSTGSSDEGDEVGPGFVVLDVPGHSPGHIAFWRESDRTLIAGDVLNST